jgi:ATP-dependent protease Clp ATPase subunit
MTDEPPKVLRCSFCGTPEADCDDMVAGPTVAICDACITQSFEIVVRARARRAKQAKAIVIEEPLNGEC